MKLNYNLEDILLDRIDNSHYKKIWEIAYAMYAGIYYHFPQFYRRMICHVCGCKIKGGSGGFNLPPEAYSYWCDRCGAGESNYEGDTSHKLIRR